MVLLQYALRWYRLPNPKGSRGDLDLARSSQVWKIVSDSTHFPAYQMAPTVCQGGHTRLASELNARMAGIRGYLARRRYARIWGFSWEPLPLDLVAITPLTADRADRAAAATVR